MRYLVTGGAGFIGSHLVDTLLARGNEVRILDNLSTGKRENLNPSAEFIEGDIRNLEAIRPAFERVDGVFHVAALPRVQLSIEEPRETNEVNITGTLNVLLAARDAKVKRLIYSASSSAYGDPPSLPLREDMKLNSKSPYGLQKYVGEEYAKLASLFWGLETVSLRYFNVYGPRMASEGAYVTVIAIFNRQKLAGQPLTITGDGTQTRDFTYIDDVVRANLLAMESSKVGKGEVLNIGAGSNHSVNEVASLVGGPTKYIPPRIEPHDTLADITKANELLGWEPSTNFRTGLARTMEWYVRQAHGKPVPERATARFQAGHWARFLGGSPNADGEETEYPGERGGPLLEERRIAVVGLGYVGLPLAVAFGKSKLALVIGFDIKEERVSELARGLDSTGELSREELALAKVEYTNDAERLREANFIIMAIPTPVTQAKKPDLGPLASAAETVGRNLSRGAIVVIESTVYPGVTEDICVPAIERASGLACGRDWKIGYSPERINPGDREHTLETIVKVVSGMDSQTLEEIARIYSLVCKGGIHRAPNIKTAEAAKVIENVQRDLNIALANELALIFARLGISTKEVLDAASTKWNFHRYQPGLVGGHCIGVDPYYLTYRAEELGYHPEIILAGRRINDSMADYVAELTIKGLIEAGKKVQHATVLVLGLTFKENVRDTRNSKVKDVIKKLHEYQVRVLAHDPLLSEEEVNGFGVRNIADLRDIEEKVDGIILAVPHRQFKELAVSDFTRLMHNPSVFVDVKGLYAGLDTWGRGIIYKSF